MLLLNTKIQATAPRTTIWLDQCSANKFEQKAQRCCIKYYNNKYYKGTVFSIKVCGCYTVQARQQPLTTLKRMKWVEHKNEWTKNESSVDHIKSRGVGCCLDTKLSHRSSQMQYTVRSLLLNNVILN